MNTQNNLQAKFETLEQANAWVAKKVNSKKWTNGKVKSAIVQAAGGVNVTMYFASVQNPNPPLSPYTGKPNGTTGFANHLFMGQIVTERDICATTIARGLVEGD